MLADWTAGYHMDSIILFLKYTWARPKILTFIHGQKFQKGEEKKGGIFIINFEVSEISIKIDSLIGILTSRNTTEAILFLYYKRQYNISVKIRLN